MSREFGLIAHLTAAENVALPLRISNARETQIRDYVAELLRWVGLGQDLDELPSALSDAQKQRVAIARAVIARPDLLLADEPTGNVDDNAAVRLIHLLEELNKVGTTVLVATHDDSLVSRFGHPALVLDGGELRRADPLTRCAKRSTRHDDRTRPYLPGAAAGTRRIEPLRPWIVAAMVYVAAFALAAALAIESAERGWNGALAGRISVQVPPPADRAAAPVAEIVGLLRATPAIAEAAPIEDTASRSLLEPWLGAGAALDTLPLPTLIDVRLRPGVQLDIVALEVALDAAVPGTRIDDHGLWLARTLRFTLALKIFAAAVVVLFGLTAVATAAFATRAGLAAHDEAIGILRLIGAQDGFIAGRFVAQSRNLAIKGGIAGCALAAATLFLLGRYAPGGSALMLPDMTLSPIHWAALAGLPLAVAALGMAAARLTVMRALSRMP